LINSPFLTVGIPAFNNVETLIRAMNSIKEQEFKDLEILISDDCSTVDIRTNVEEWSLLNPEILVRYFYQSQNLHITSNKRWLLEHARGTLFAFLEHDDLLIDKNFYLMVHGLYTQNPNIKAFIGNALLDSPLGAELFYKGKIHAESSKYGFSVINPRKLIWKLNSVLSPEPISINWSSVVVDRMSSLEVDAFGFTYLTNPQLGSLIKAFPHEEHMIFITLIHDKHPIAYSSKAVSHRKISETSFSINFDSYTSETEYLNDIAFFNFFRAAELADSRLTRFHLYKRSILTGLRILTPDIRRYLARSRSQNVFIILGWIVGNFVNPALHPLLRIIRRSRRLLHLISRERRYLLSRIKEKFRVIFAPAKR
jgi:glycosyltransferase involved in cell wall biosynthesis